MSECVIVRLACIWYRIIADFLMVWRKIQILGDYRIADTPNQCGGEGHS